MTRASDRRFSVRSRPLPAAFDLLAACSWPAGERFLFERMGLGAGVQLSVGGSVDLVERPADETGLRELGRSVVETLRTFRTHGRSGPIAVGAFPFEQGEQALLSIPSRAVRRGRSGETWLVELVADDTEIPAFAPARPEVSMPAAPFKAVQLEGIPTTEDYAGAVEVATTRIREGTLRKVVLARTLEVHARRRLDAVHLAHRLRSVDPECFVFCAPVGSGPVGGGPPDPRAEIVGASPELLVERAGRQVRSTPLAGSAPRSGDPEEDRAHADALAASPKNREEHEIVVDAIAEGLRPFCEDLAWDPEPVLKGTANVWHLATRFRGVLREPAANAVELVAALHPTPAVCGTPRDAAAAAIEELEPFDRGSYAGPVGWMDADGDGVWAIALRCAELRGERATLYAGAGIVADSVPLDEVDETERKFRSFLDALRWG